MTRINYLIISIIISSTKANAEVLWITEEGKTDLFKVMD